MKGKALTKIKLCTSAGQANSAKKKKKKKREFKSKTSISPKMSPLMSRSIGKPIFNQSSLILPHMPLNDYHKRQLSIATRISSIVIYVLAMEDTVMVLEMCSKTKSAHKSTHTYSCTDHREETKS